MKRLTTILLIAAMLMTAACALASQPTHEETARSAVPSEAELIRTRTDDGLTVYDFRTPEGLAYEVDVDPKTGSIVQVDIDVPGEKGGSSVVITPEQAKAALLVLWPEAEIFLTTEDRDDGRYEYQLYFRTADFIGRAELNAETGALMDAELDYTSAARIQVQGPLTAEQAKELVLSLVTNGRITDFETEREDSRKTYEGEICADEGRYEFVIDAETGHITEWESDR